jgi:hypothetical protein
MTSLTGGCHCGRVRFRVDVEHFEALDCNCSICTKKGILHRLVPKEQFTLLAGGDALATYTFGTHTAKHHFCRHCGMHPFYIPRSHPDGVDVNVRCLDDDDARARFVIVPFDGRHWEENVASIRA